VSYFSSGKSSPAHEDLGALLRHDKMMDIMSSDSGPREKIKSIYPFIRHPISSVRLSVSNTLHVFATDPRLSREDWMHDEFFSYLYQNLILDEHSDIRDLSLSALSAALQEQDESGCLETVEEMLEDWYEMVMTPPGQIIDETLFRKIPKGGGGHDIDKHVMTGDLSLMTMDSVLERRISAAMALAVFRRLGSEEVSQDPSRHCKASG
jgi:TATA-binding protein-associated factor